MNTYARRLESLTSWLEWCFESQHEALDKCTSCGGWGDHGFEEENGFPHTCYACCGTGKYHLASEAQ